MEYLRGAFSRVQCFGVVAEPQRRWRGRRDQENKGGNDLDLYVCPCVADATLRCDALNQNCLPRTSGDGIVSRS